MKYVLPLLSIISLTIIACNKKNNAAAIRTKPSYSLNKDAAVTQLPVIQYLYTDTFIGKIFVSYNGGDPYVNYTKPSYAFYVDHTYR